MKFINTYIKDLIIIEQITHHDERGWFSESYNKNLFELNGIFVDFVQDNHSHSNKKGVLRGIHFQNEPYAQTKLVRCTKGKIWDVAIDLRKSSPTYLKWFGLELSSKNDKQLLIPKGFGHGFITLEENCEVQYKVDNYYNKSFDRSINYKDPQINIKWPIDNVILSDKDNKAIFLKDSDVNF